jgi:twitching motility two-component system response regulator PilH
MAVNKVLVVDDSPADLANIKGIVSEAGCTVVTATNGAEAIAMAKSEKPQLIFLDILMPDMDGFEACRKLGSDGATRDIPVVFVTSKGQKADRMWAHMQGGKDLVAKPFTPAQIIEQIKAF